MLPSPQFAAGCFRVRGSFITCGIDELRVNDIRVAGFPFELSRDISPVVGGANAQTVISLAGAHLSSPLF